MRHEEVLSRLDGYLDDALSAAERREVEDHLSGCNTCRAELTSIGVLLDTVADLRARTVEPDHDLWPGIARRITERPPARGRIFLGPSPTGISPAELFWRWAVVGVGVVAAIFLAMVLRSEDPGSSGKARGPSSTFPAPGSTSGPASDRGREPAGRDIRMAPLAAIDGELAGLHAELAGLDAEVAAARKLLNLPLPDESRSGSTGGPLEGARGMPADAPTRGVMSAPGEAAGATSPSDGTIGPEAGSPWAVIADNLRVLDHAIGESRQALARDPGNPVLRRSVFAAYQKELELLRWASRLVDMG